MERRRIGRLLGVTFVVSAALRLTGFIELFVGAVTSVRETAGNIAAFWLPLVGAWILLLGVGWALDRGVRTASNDGESEKSGESVDLDRLRVAEHPRTKIEALERNLDRAESVLEEQLRVLADTDDKAVRTVRVEVILLGAIASATQITRQTVPINIWMKVSGALVIGSIVAGIFTYSTSNPDFGPGPKYVYPNFENGDGRSEIYARLLKGYAKAIAHNRAEVNDSGRYLFVTQILLVAGIVTGGIGVLIVL